MTTTITISLTRSHRKKNRETSSKLPEHLRRPCPADAEMSGQSGAVLELAGVEQGLVVVGELHPVRVFLWGRLRSRFLRETATPRQKLDDRGST